MEILTVPKHYSGKNERGKPFSAMLEIPFFSCDELDGFYSELTERIVKRAQDEGVNAFSKLCVTHCDGGSFSLYLDILFCDKRTVTDLFRVCDNRRDGVEIPLPQKLKRRGYDGFCIKEGRILAFKNNFDPSIELKRKDYLSLIAQTVLDH